MPAGIVQGDLFAEPDTLRNKALMAALDTINRRHGRGTIATATADAQQAWRLRAEMHSPPYTTRWDDLLQV